MSVCNTPSLLYCTLDLDICKFRWGYEYGRKGREFIVKTKRKKNKKKKKDKKETMEIVTRKYEIVCGITKHKS